MAVSSDLEKVEAIQAWPRPVSITDVKSFLELASYYRHFLAGFANIAAPLHECTKKTTTFAQAAFTKLKIVFIEAPVLAYPDPSYPFLLDTDADALSRCPCFDTGCKHCSKRDSTEELHMAAYPPLRPATDEDTSSLVRAVALNARTTQAVWLRCLISSPRESVN